jgi:hypothetical protein
VSATREEYAPDRATYYFDPGTFFPRTQVSAGCGTTEKIKGPFFVEVVINKTDGSIETRKYRGKGLVSAAAGQDFPMAMLHAAVTGLEEDNVADES